MSDDIPVKPSSKPRKLGDVLREKEKASAEKPPRHRAKRSVGLQNDAPPVVTPETVVAAPGNVPPVEDTPAPRVAAGAAFKTKLTEDEREQALKDAFALPYDPPSYHIEPSTESTLLDTTQC